MNWRNAAIGGAAALVITALLGYGMTKDPAEIPSPLPGKVAPTFALQTLDQKQMVDLSKLRGQVVVLNFWASWCLNCRDEHPVLQQVGTEYASNPKVKFYGVVYNDTPENAEQWLVEMGAVPYPSLVDPNARTAIDYGLYGVPETFFISKSGRVAYKQIGPVTPEIVHKWVNQLLQEAS